MRVLSILCGLSFSVVAGYLLACSLIASWAGLPVQNLAPGAPALFWSVLALALIGAVVALGSRCEGWAPMLSGCAVFLLGQLLAPHIAGLNFSAALCLAAGGLALLPLMRTPSSYWRVAG